MIAKSFTIKIAHCVNTKTFKTFKEPADMSTQNMLKKHKVTKNAVLFGTGRQEIGSGGPNFKFQNFSAGRSFSVSQFFILVGFSHI